jgi:PEP-CTERM motif
LVDAARAKIGNAGTGWPFPLTSLSGRVLGREEVSLVSAQSVRRGKDLLGASQASFDGKGPVVRFARTLATLGILSAAAAPSRAATFTAGEFVTYDQSDFGTSSRFGLYNPQAAALLENNFDTVYAPFEDLLQVGIPGPAGYSIIFDSPDAVLAYLPAGGSPGPLTADLLDPISSASGYFGGEVVDTTLNVDFSNAGLLAHPAGVTFGDLVFQNLGALVGTPFVTGIDSDIAELDGLPIHEVLSEANLALGGYPSTISAADFAAALYVADDAFKDGLLPVDTFVNGDVFVPSSYLVAPNTTAPAAPEPSTWAMLALGFAGLAFARYRISGKGRAVGSGSRSNGVELIREADPSIVSQHPARG